MLIYSSDIAGKFQKSLPVSFNRRCERTFKMPAARHEQSRVEFHDAPMKIVETDTRKVNSFEKFV